MVAPRLALTEVVMRSVCSPCALMMISRFMVALGIGPLGPVHVVGAVRVAVTAVLDRISQGWLVQLPPWSKLKSASCLPAVNTVVAGVVRAGRSTTLVPGGP